MFRKHLGVRNMSEGERKDTREGKGLSVKGARIIQLGCQGNVEKLTLVGV